MMKSVFLSCTSSCKQMSFFTPGHDQNVIFKLGSSLAITLFFHPKSSHAWNSRQQLLQRKHHFHNGVVHKERRQYGWEGSKFHWNLPMDRSMEDRMLVIWAAQPGPNGHFPCHHSFKIFWPMKPSYSSNKICSTFWCNNIWWFWKFVSL